MAVELVAGVKIVARLVGAGLSVYRATRGHGKPEELEKDLKAIQDLLDTGQQLASAWNGKETTRIRARHIALVAGAFGQAWLEQYLPRLAFERQSSVETHREAAVRWALMELPRAARPAPTAEIELLDRLLAGVLEAPYYTALWEAFTKPHLPDLKHDWPEPLIAITSGDDKRRFETRVRHAYAEALASPAGSEVRAYLLELAQDRGRLVRELLVHDISTWGRRHVFGNVVKHTRLPDMPLAEMYVEPLATVSSEPAGDVELPITALVDQLFASSHLMVVSAHFGHGKSLTARTLAWRLAMAYLDDVTTPGPDRVLPVFIKCVEDVVGSEARLPRMAERALWRHVGLGFQLGLKDTDPAFAGPPDTQRAVFLLDGLDEFAFTPAAAVQLFEHLRGQATDRHRIIVFSRPEVLPRKRLSELAIPVLELQPFSTIGDGGGQVGEWLQKWNRHAAGRPEVRYEQIAARGLSSLAQTPILLFMISETWGHVPEVDGRIRQADIYEVFLGHVARGKHDDDRDNHEPIAQAAERLHRRLIELDRLSPDAGLHQAMVWAMSRIAWESHCMEQQGKPLTQRKVIELLSKELKLDDEAEPIHQSIYDGVLLALQADFSPSSSRILFGHRSFREFLVARHWERALWRIVEADGADWRTLERGLLGGRLMGIEDRSFEFLIELLEHWDAPQRGVLRRWADQTFNDERISQPDEVAGALLYHDRRAYLREAALAIGSCVDGATGIEARHPTVLRSLLAWFWARGKQAIIRAPRLRHPGAQLREVKLSGAIFANAHLQGADFSEAELLQVNLAGADLSRAKLQSTRLVASTLTGATADGCQMHASSLVDVDLTRASFAGSVMTHSSFVDCIFDGTNLSGVDLRDSMMDLSYARQVAILTGSQTERINEQLLGQAIQRPGIMADVLNALSAPDVVHLSWWVVGTAPDPTTRTSYPLMSFRITVPADMADRVIQSASNIPGIVSIGRSLSRRKR